MIDNRVINNAERTASSSLALSSDVHLQNAESVGQGGAQSQLECRDVSAPINANCNKLHSNVLWYKM